MTVLTSPPAGDGKGEASHLALHTLPEDIPEDTPAMQAAKVSIYPDDSNFQYIIIVK